MIYAFEIEFDVSPNQAEPLLQALKIAIEASHTYKNVVHFSVYEKFLAVMGQEPEKKVVFVQSYTTPDGNQQHFQDPIVRETVHPVFNQYQSRVYHYTSL